MRTGLSMTGMEQRRPTPQVAASSSGASETAEASKPVPQTTKPLALQQMEDVKSPAYQMGMIGFKAGAIVKLKKPDPKCPCTLWTVKEVGDNSALLGATGIHSELKEKAVLLASLKEEWCVTTAKPQVQIDIAVMNPERNTGWMLDRVKAQIQLALGCLSEDTNWHTFGKVNVFTNPHAVVATKDFDQWELVLAPATQNVRTRLPQDKLPEKAIDLGPLMHSPVTHFHLMPQFVVNKSEGQNFVCLFWCVPQASEGQEPNMTQIWAHHTINVVLKTGDTPENLHVHLPLLKNHRKIKVGEVLCQGVPKPKPARSVGSPSGSPAAKAAKRAR